MSSEEEKFAHSKRIHQKNTSIQKQVHIAKEFGAPIDTPHKYAKHHALNCGNPKCVMCANPRKTFKELTAKEKRMFQPELQDEFTHKTDN